MYSLPRLNVSVTRARKKVIVILSDLVSPLPDALRIVCRVPAQGRHCMNVLQVRRPGLAVLESPGRLEGYEFLQVGAELPLKPHSWLVM